VARRLGRGLDGADLSVRLILAATFLGLAAAHPAAAGFGTDTQKLWVQMDWTI
jgi:hypothetical protein